MKSTIPLLTNLYKGFLIIICISQPIYSMDSFVPILEKITGQKVWQPGEQFSVFKEKEQLLAEEKQELAELLATDKEFSTQTSQELSELSHSSALINKQLYKVSNTELLKKKILVIDDLYQTVQDTQRMREQLKNTLNTTIKQLIAFLADTDFASYKKEHKLFDRLYYTFDDIQRLHEKKLEQSKKMVQLVEQEKTARTELDNHKRAIASTLTMIKKKQEELLEENSFLGGNAGHDELYRENRETIELLKLEEQLYISKKNFNALKLRDLKHTIELYAFQAFVAKTELELLEQYLQKIKPSVRVTEADIVHARDEFNASKQEHYKHKEENRATIEKLQEKLKTEEQILNSISKQHNIPLGSELSKWTKEPVKTAKGYCNLYEVALVNTTYVTLEKQLEQQEQQNAVDEERLNLKSIQVQIKESFQKITSRKLSADDDIVKEVKKYETMYADLKTKENKYKEKLNQTNELISSRKTILDILSQHTATIHTMHETVFHGKQAEYDKAIDLLKKAEVQIKNQLDTLSALTGIYSGILSAINNTQRLILFIKIELETITIWRRSEHAINWQGLSDSILFLSDMRTYITHFEPRLLIKQIHDALRNGMHLFITVLQLFLLFLIMYVLCLFAPPLAGYLQAMQLQQSGIKRSITLLLLFCIQYYQKYFYWILGWTITLRLLQSNFLPDPYLYAFFYLISIPYLLSLAYYFIKDLNAYNSAYGYALYSKTMRRRVTTVLGMLLYTTITMLLFREAFIIASYYKSELPTILLAITSIIITLAPIFLLSKERILNLIPLHTAVGKWIKSTIYNHYYLLQLLVCTIIIMINPYVGFGRLVSHLFFNIVYSCIFIFFLIWVYSLFKEMISRIFFFTDQEITRERFTDAKAWFGFIVIAAFVTLLFVGIVINAKIWGWQIGLGDLIALLNEPITGKGTVNPITVASLLQIIGFIASGFLVAYAINNFVIDKIFDLLQIEPGVQYAATRIMQYLVVTIATFIGFQSVGLGQLISLLIGGLALSLGWVLKEPVSDFVAYFMILVQRPIKIGDYIEIDDEIKGVVRKITPRSVLLRKKNSTMIVTPNSLVTSKAITNWNYSRNFTAFNDIILVVGYAEDPSSIKQLLQEAVDSHPNVLKNPPSVVRLDNFTENGYEFMVRGYISSVYTLEQWNIASDVRLSIVTSLRKQGIMLAVPVRVIKNSESSS